MIDPGISCAGIRELFQQTSRDAVTALLQVPTSMESEPAIIETPETPRVKKVSSTTTTGVNYNR